MRRPTESLKEIGQAAAGAGAFAREQYREVVIADVDALVIASSAIDQYAQRNTTSVYTAAQVFPMLPEKLSTDLTSLSEGEDRSAVVTEIVVAPDNSLGEGTIYRATVSNRAKLALQQRGRLA